MRAMYLGLMKRTVAIACCLASIYSFLVSSFFRVLAAWITETFATEGIPIFLGLDLGTFMKFGLLLIIGLYAVSIISSKGDGEYSGLLVFSLALYLPEALSLSEINYFNVAGLSTLFTPTRDSWAVLVTGLVIVQSYVLHVVVGDSADLSNRCLSLGAEPSDVESVTDGQLRFTALFALLSVAALFVVVVTTSLASSTLNELLSELPLRHLIYGTLSIIIVAVAIVIYITRSTRPDV